MVPGLYRTDSSWLTRFPDTWVLVRACPVSRVKELLPIPPCQIKERTGNEEFRPSRGRPGPLEKETAYERRRPKQSVL